jgi:3-deoxy-manno-octulosonate cytidylyltransferase (CMP-KDO synthetase)
MHISGIIPARYASTRLPGKPLINILGKPMIQRVYERVSDVLDDVYVATDDDRIYNCVKGFEGKVLMTSPIHTTGTERCAEAIEILEARNYNSPDVVINIQGDEPFIHQEHINAIVSCFNDNDVQIATLIKQFDPHEDLFQPGLVKVIKNIHNNAIYFSRAVIPYVRNHAKEEWSSKCMFYKHIGIYAYRRDVLKEIVTLKPTRLELAESLEQIRWIENGYRIKVNVTDKESIPVDTPEDIEKISRMNIEDC